MELPRKYDPHEREVYWKEWWEKEGIYSFPRERAAELFKAGKVFSIDTPPPTVSGRMHVGHSFSYSQMDFIARYKRMSGYEVFYPFGTDDNGLATERLVEKMNNVRSTDMSREDFVRLCRKTVDSLRPEFVDDWKRIGTSCDFSLFYSTINPDVIRISQKYFLDLVRKGRVYRKESPTIFCPECRTAIAQVEMEDREMESFMNTIRFDLVGGGHIEIGTTRPELLPACVSIFVNPDDPRAKELEGRKALVPLFGHEVPILLDPDVDMEKGTGIVMCCTFGDQKDMEWYKQYGLPLRMAISQDGTMTEIAGKYRGMRPDEARKAILEDLEKEGHLLKQERITHSVNVHERCGTPVEIVHSPQWYIRVLDLKEKLLEMGNKFEWHPPHMKSRYDNWVRGLKWDWCISRQRFFGVPFPVWYDKNGEPVFPDEDELPVDPTVQKPRGREGEELTPEKDVMDTWATSSLTPVIGLSLVSGNPGEMLPMDLRPQAHDIISFWLFNTVVRTLIHHGSIPWKHAMISGWVLDPHGRKMSKSKGNVIDPREMIQKYSADALRYAASIVKTGHDSPFQEKDLKKGQATVTKIFNVGKFAVMHLRNWSGERRQPEALVDRWALTRLSLALKEYRERFEEYDYSGARRVAERFFWDVLADNYLEFIKHRAYENPTLGLYTALRDVVFCSLQMWAPFMPFITEEVYHFYQWSDEKSIHRTTLPDSIPEYPEEMKWGDMLAKVVSEIRKYKSQNGLSMKSEVRKIKLRLPEEPPKEFLDEVAAIMNVREIEVGHGELGVGFV